MLTRLRHTAPLWLVLLTSCTFVSIEGNSNTVSDTGGHGGGVTLPAASSQPTLADRLHEWNAKPN
ncbi:hypothetical protein LFL96_12605 [Paraburkholderia sp. D15]|uniref:hypothetical protein n=1 Tax=Paraburkholderia sp. D15 TaxID=2880218 RepID=UPI002478C9F0|nr:hypothetical protein [Paraburkholderia sp. D15]WGS48628.1 hypothetical protein LFL96_12605 [Paraburkholderia sp. D15]